MESAAEEPLTVALASTGMPRSADGTTSMQELLRQLAESIANETMGAEAEQLCGETGTGRDGLPRQEAHRLRGDAGSQDPQDGEGGGLLP